MIAEVFGNVTVGILACLANNLEKCVTMSPDFHSCLMPRCQHEVRIGESFPLNHRQESLEVIITQFIQSIKNQQDLGLITANKMKNFSSSPSLASSGSR